MSGDRDYIRPEDREFFEKISQSRETLTIADRLQILSLAQALVIEKKFGIFRLEDLCKGLETYILTGSFAPEFSAHYKSLIEKSGFPYRASPK